MAPMRVGVLAVQGNFREHAAMLRALGADVVEVRLPEQLEGLDGLVIPGGESTAITRLMRLYGLEEAIRQFAAPVLGTCAGMILLADRIEDGVVGQETIGGLDVVVRRNAFGRQVDSFEADLALSLPTPGQVDPFHAVFIRAPWVEELGPAVDVVATIASGPAAGRIVAVRQRHLLATSFHPEVTGDDRLHRYFADIVRERGA
jgi:pyridoxal 5'-phosphate synthase pdxT subunit